VKSSICSKRARERIPNDVRRRIAQYSNFACSICGKIPIIFHHIEEWSKKYSNDEKYLITICDTCHRRIHGEFGSLFSKKELYYYKDNPKKPLLLRDKLPLEKKRKYSFFLGSNFLADGERAHYRFSGASLFTLDTSNGLLKLSILSGIQNWEPVYLMRDNELMLDTQNVWDMSYTGNSLKIWKIIDNKKSIFINLIFKSEVIIIKEMNTSFNGTPFRVFKIRSPQKRQVEKIVRKVKEFEELYYEKSLEIDNLPGIHGIYRGIDYDAEIKKIQKSSLKRDLQKYLMYEFCKEFEWEWYYYDKVLSEILEKSSVFKSNNLSILFPEELRRTKERIELIRKKYSNEFDTLDNIVVKYGDSIHYGNIIQKGSVEIG
jgi:hypothetical protein